MRHSRHIISQSINQVWDHPVSGPIADPDIRLGGFNVSQYLTFISSLEGGGL